MSKLYQDPFTACALVNNMSPTNVQEVNDCCYQSCYRNGGDEDCLRQCRLAGREILTRVVGRTPCGYGRAFVAPPTHDKVGIVGDLLVQGISLSEAINQCLACATSEEDQKNCIIDGMSFAIGQKLENTKINTKENFVYPANIQTGGKYYWIAFVVVFFVLSYLLIRGIMQLTK